MQEEDGGDPVAVAVEAAVEPQAVQEGRVGMASCISFGRKFDAVGSYYLRQHRR